MSESTLPKTHICEHCFAEAQKPDLAIHAVLLRDRRTGEIHTIERSFHITCLKPWIDAQMKETGRDWSK